MEGTSFSGESLFSAPDKKQGCHGQGKKSGKCCFFFQVMEKSGNFDIIQ